MRVLDPRGRPVRDARISAADLDPVATSFAWTPVKSLLDGPELDFVEARTDARGIAVLPAIPRPAVLADVPGFAVAWHGSREAEYDLRAQRVVRLVPPCSLRGRVIEVDGQPCPGAEVAVFPQGKSGRPIAFAPLATATCDGDGRFELARLTPGRTHVHLRVARRAPWALAARVDVGTVGEIDVVAPETGTVEGTVTGTDGAPAAGARLWLPIDGTEQGVTTDADGRCRVEGVPAGVLWGPWTELPGFAPAWAGPVGDAARVPAGGVLRLDARLRRGARVSGRVLREGVPVAGADLRILVSTPDFNEPQALRATTDRAGRWRAHGAAPGAAFVEVRGHGVAERWWRGPDVVDFAVPPETEEVRHDVRATRADARSAPGAAGDGRRRVRVRVLDARGGAVRGAVVRWIGRPGRGTPPDDAEGFGRRERAARNDGTADFALCSLSPYVVWAEAPGAVSSRARLPPGRRRACLVLRLRPRPVLLGTVTDGASPVAGARVNVLGPRALRTFMPPPVGADLSVAVHATTDEHGRFAVPLRRRGRHALHVQTIDGAVAATRVDVPCAPVTVVLAAVGAVRGRVVWPDDTPCAGLCVAVDDARRLVWYGPDAGGASGPGWALTREDGTFVIRGVPDGGAVSLALGRHRAGGANVPRLVVDDVAVGGPPFELVVPHGHRLAGRVLDASGAAPHDAHVVAWSARFESPAAPQWSPVADDGSFEVLGLPPPPWRIVVDEGHGPRARRVVDTTVQDGADVELRAERGEE